MTSCAETNFTSLRTHLSDNNRTAVPSYVHISSLFCFVIVFLFTSYLFILFISILLFIAFILLFFLSCVHILTKYNGWNSRLLRSSHCKQTYVK